jgi:group II intron reverse transcriptase/maturase/CRISPR-associated endonuclease Cas1
VDIYTQLCREETLWEAWKKVRKKNARGGIDGIQPEDLDDRIQKVILDLSQKLLNESYTPAPFDQMRVPKFNAANEWRPLSLPVVTDKIVQQALVNLISPELDKTFLDCSYAYRPKKGPRRAIGRVEHVLTTRKAQWVVTFDIDNFFDTLNHDLLLKLVRKRCEDQRLIDLIQLWLTAGYITQKGGYTEPEEGIAQGSIISPLLSNIYLHELDIFAVNKSFPYVRYADNFITLFSQRDNAYLCNENIKAFLQEELQLNLNPDSSPVKHVKGGFTFLGIFFKGNQRHMSRQKETKTFKKLNWLTDIHHAVSPDITLKKLNESTQAQKRFYSFIKPERQFASFDVHLKKRLIVLLAAFERKGLLNSRRGFEHFIQRVEFYKRRDMKEQQSLQKTIVEEACAKFREASKNNEARSSAGKRASGASTRRSSAQKSRFLRQVADEAEVVVSSPGVFIGKTGKRLVIREARKNIHEHPFSKIRQITVTANGVSLSSDVIWSCGTNKVPLVFINRKGIAYATLQSPNYSMGDLSVLQVRMHETEKALNLAKKIISGKSRNQMNLIKFYTRHRSKTDPVFSNRVSSSLESMEKDLNEIHQVNTREGYPVAKNRLFTTEARISSYYWYIVRLLLPPELSFEKRDKRGAKDVVNNMLNYGYGILYQRVWHAVNMVGLNPNISFFHSFQKNKPTLVFDFIEEFRQALVDRPLFSLMTKGTRYKKLKIDRDTGLMDKFTKETTLRTVLHRLASLIGFRGKKIRAEDMIQKQARHLADFIMEKKKTYRPFISTY